MKRTNVLLTTILILLILFTIYVFSTINTPRVATDLKTITSSGTTPPLTKNEGIKTGEISSPNCDYADIRNYGYYVIQNNSVYYIEKTGQMIPADAKFFGTFGITNFYLGKDQNSVFYKGLVVDNADVNTFTVLWDTGDGFGGLFARDKNRVYTIDDNEIAEIGGADPATFQKTNNLFYKKDKNTVYLFLGSIQHLLRIKDANPVSFQVLSGYPRCSAIEKSGSYYAKDESRVFCGEETVKDADPTTFKVLGNYDENPGGMYSTLGIAKDKSCIFLGRKKVLDVQGACVDPNSCTEANFEKLGQSGEKFLKFGCGLK